LLDRLPLELALLGLALLEPALLESGPPDRWAGATAGAAARAAMMSAETMNPAGLVRIG
jgi:hypothetical protein